MNDSGDRPSPKSVEAERLYGDARELDSAARALHLETACAGRPELLAEVLSLLEHAEAAEAFFGHLQRHALSSPPWREPGDAYDAATSAAHDLPPGTPVGRYRIVARIGAGAMGTVYRAHDPALGRDVALKLLQPQLAADSEARERFLREARAVAALDHPNICTIHEVGEAEDGRLFLAMARYQGETLKERLARGRMPIAEAVACAAGIARGLSAAHARGIVHRDVKPGNVMLLADGTVKVLDFGIAKVSGGEPTREGMTLGTVAYMSPEQTHGRTVDQRTDLWSLGVVLYEMLTGRRPFQAEDEQALIYAIRNDEPEPVAQPRPEVASELGEIVEACLEKDVARRYARAEDLLNDLYAVQSGRLARQDNLSSELSLYPDHRVGAGVEPARSAASSRMRIAALVGLAAVAVGIAIRVLLPDDRPTMANPAYTILADVDGNADVETRRAVKGLVRAGLEQASVLMPVSDAEIRNGLTRMMRPDTLELDADAARELAYRGSVRTIVAPSLDRIGSTFALTVRVLDAEDGSLIATERATSDTEDGLVPAADRVVRDLHRQLGARRAEIEAARPLVDATTPSFEAYRKFSQAETRYWSRGGDMIGMDLLREAVALDSALVAAWRLMASMWGNKGRRDSQYVAIGYAERHLHRVSEREQLWAGGQIASIRGDWPRAFALYDRLVREYPSPVSWHLRGFALGQLGRPEESADAYRRAIAEARFGPSRVTVHNLVYALTKLDRATEARSLLDSIAAEVSSPFHLQRLGIMVALEEWDRAESLVAELNEGEGEWWAPLGPVVLAGAAARRGEVARAADLIDRTARSVENEVAWWHEVAAAELLLTLVARRPWPRPPLFGTAGLVDGQAWTGIWTAVNGDTATARGIASAVRDSFPTRFRGAAPEFIDALIAAHDGRWDEVIERLGPVAGRGETGRRHHSAWVTPLPVRWLLADAYERAGQLEDAVAAYERVLATDMIPDYLLMRGIPYSFAHQRLAVLYARLGRLDDANRHWEIFRDAFTNPDPALRYLIDEAGAALEQAVRSAGDAEPEGVGRSTIHPQPPQSKSRRRLALGRPS